MSPPKLLVSALLCGAALLTILAGPGADADACGAFFAKKTKPESRASLALERTLLVFDADKREQHFLREVVFRGGKERFGFVVPTPSRPSVHAVKKSPFDDLETELPFAEPEPVARSASAGAPGGGAPQPKVQVLEVKYLGSFTSFVIRATDATAFARWLEDNQLGSSAENDEWLAEYVARGFYYVALRYEPALDRQKLVPGVRAQTLRISFSTPVAYYPYREPNHTRGTEDRAAELWVVSNEPLSPVALVDGAAGPEWVRPFQEGVRRTGVEPARLAALLDVEDAKLLPAKPSLVVQTFQDQKSSRKGYGDVVFMPTAGLQGERAASALELVRSTLLPGGAK